MKKTAYEIVTDRIIEQLEKGVVPWQQPWKVTEHKNFVTRKNYRGVNALVLMMSGYDCPFWGTFKQISDKGGSVKKGSKSTPILFTTWKEIEDKETGEVVKRYPITRYYRVFNLQQTDGIDYSTWDTGKPVINSLEKCEEILTKGAQNIPEIKEGGTKACYVPSCDLIRMPKRESFYSSEGYYSTLYHEMIHSTGHESRLNRPGITERINFGSDRYSQEELIAEIGACFLNAYSGIENIVFDNNSAYVASWLKAFKNDRKMIVIAAAQSQKAVDFILGNSAE